MSFSEDIRGELIRTECLWDCCARAELAAALLLSGGISFRGRGRYALCLSTPHNSVSRYYFALIKKHFGISCEIRTAKSARMGESMRFELSFPDGSVPELMERLMLTDEGALFGVRVAPAAELVSRGCCRASFLKSAFLIAGSTSRPEKEYAVFLSAGNEETANAVAALMREYVLNAGVSPRRAQYVAYLKGAEDISTFLTVIGAHAAMMKLENTRIIKQLRNQANRLTNCDSNNIERALRSAQAQIDDIELIDEKLGLETLPSPLLEIARLRLNDPEATLYELGEMCSPPIGKSGVNNRLRRLSDMAKNLREGD